MSKAKWHRVPPEAIEILREVQDSLDDEAQWQRLDGLIPKRGHPKGRVRPKPGSVREAISQLAWEVSDWQDEQHKLRPKIPKDETDQKIEDRISAYRVLKDVDRQHVIKQVQNLLNDKRRLPPRPRRPLTPRVRPPR